MSEFASRGPEHARGPAPTTRSTAAETVRSPKERALDTILTSVREIDTLSGAIDLVRRAGVANDPAQWQDARQRLDRDLALAERALEKARACATDAGTEGRPHLSRGAQVLANVRATAATLTEPPHGWTPCSREREILSILREPVVGAVKAGHEQKERALRSILSELDITECAQLARRIQKAQAGDPLVAELARMIPARRARLIEFLGDARRRSSLAAARSNHATDSAPKPTGSAWVQALPKKLRSDMDVSEHDAESDGAERVSRVELSQPSWTPTTSAAAPQTAPKAETPADLIREVQEGTRADVAWAYVRANEPHFMTAIEHRVASFHAPSFGGFTWIAGGLAAQFRSTLSVALGSKSLWSRLPELLHPADPWNLVDQHRVLTQGTPGVVVDGAEPRGPMTWNPLAGDALATEMLARLRESVARMAPRFVAQRDAKRPAPVMPADLVASHPFDPIVAVLLCEPQVVQPEQTTKHPQAHATVGAFHDGIRFLADYEWLGKKDRALWNWIEVREPRDATAEDVAATLWLDPAASSRAYGITAAPPFFRVDPGWARMFPDAQPFAPNGVDKPHDDNALALAGSSLATDVAIAQAGGTPPIGKQQVAVRPDHEQLRKTLDQSQRQLDRMKAQLAPWRVWEQLLPALQWVAAQREHLLEVTDERLAALAPVIDGQQAVLFDVAGAVSELDASVAGAIGAETSEGPITNVLRLFATAAGESHLVQAARPALARAQAARGSLSIALLDRSAREAAASVGELRQNETTFEYGSVAGAATVGDAQRRIVELRARQATGETIDADEVSLLSAVLKDQATDASMRSWYLTLSNLREEARDSTFGAFETLASSMSASVRSLPNRISEVITHLQESVIVPYRTEKAQKLKEAGDDKKARALALQGVVQRARVDLDAFLAAPVGITTLRDALAGWVEIVQSQRTRTAVLQIATHIAILVGTSVVGGFVGNLAASAVRGALLADAAESTVGMLWGTRIANATATVTGLAADASINATVQTAISGDHFADAFLDNFLANGAIRGLLVPLHQIAGAYGGAEKEVANLGLWERAAGRGATVLRAGVVLTADMITSAAVDYVVHRVRSGEKPDDKTAMQWVLQGASMAIGSYVGHWLHGFESRVTTLAEQGAQLARRAARMRKVAVQVERSGDKQAAMDLLIERHELLDKEATTIDELLGKGTISDDTAGKLATGNRAERTAVVTSSFATMPLRLAHLAPDDASGRVWTGSTEDIAVALDQAHRCGLAVEVIEHDVAARRWRILYNREELTIIETELAGRPRSAKPQPSGTDRAQAQRYAEAAEYLQAQWEARVKTDLDHRAVIEVDHLQTGYAFAGVVSQATLPATGEALDAKLVVYSHKGTLSKRGAQELGQSPDKFDAPGVRATEQAPANSEWIRSEHLDRALDVGRLETQTPAYRGTVTDLQARPKGTVPADWAAPGRRFRVKVRDAEGAERWFYCDRYDNTGGLGPASLKAADGVIDPQQLDAMLARNAVLRGDDPEYASKLRSGRILVWGGSPTGAWAAEAAVHRAGNEVSVLGDTQPPSDWPTLMREYEDLNHEIAEQLGEASASQLARKAEIEKQITAAHSGMTIPRNRKAGATYEKPIGHRAPSDVQIEFGTPTSIKPTGDGRLIVTVGAGDNAKASIYDQVVIAHGQDPGAPGAPGAQLGRPARGADDAVPAGAIALRPIYGPVRAGKPREILGLESVDPSGIQLKGAAFASKRMAGWVEQSQRAEFVKAVDAMAGEHATTRDHGEISADSRGVSPGVEVQRDRIPRANEVLGAKAYRLPGPDHTLELDPDHQERWDDEVRDYFAINLRAEAKWVRVTRLGGGRSGSIVYRVWVDESDVGVFKLFGRNGALEEQRMLNLLRQAKLKQVTAVHERGAIKVGAKTGFDGALLMDAANGESVKDLIEALPHVADRSAAVQQVQAAVRRVAVGLAEIHRSFEGGGMMTKEAKHQDADWFLNNNFRGGHDETRVRAALGESDFARVKAAIEGPMLDSFMAAEVPATAYHGDANAGNFLVGDYDPRVGYKQLGMIDVGAMSYSVSGRTGTKTGAADVARFLGSLETLAPGVLTAGELQDLRADFSRTYFKSASHRQIDRAAFGNAEKWYRIEMEIAVLKNDPSAKRRILELLELRP